MNTSRQHWSLYVVAAIAVGALMMLGGCAGCGGGGQCPEEGCPGDQVCNNQGRCVSSGGGCPGDCAPGQTCESGQCVWDDAQCQGAGEPCNPSGPVDDGFLCVPWSGDRSDARCAKVCGPEEGCGQGAACVVLQTISDGSCQSSSDCPADKNCTSGTCRFSACRPSECEGFLEGDATCEETYGDDDRQYPDGAKCYPVRNDANYCLPAGTREVGETCNSIERAVQEDDYTATCGVGLACEDGTCVQACRSDDGCSDDRQCVGIDSSTVRDGVGQCASTCTPFTDGACGDGETCRPISEDAGRCVEAGDRSAFAACDPGAGQCQEGLACVTHQAGDPRLGLDEIGRCHPICNTSLGERNEDGELPDDVRQRRDATCPQPEPVPAAYRVVHVADGAETVDVYRQGVSMPIVSGLAPRDSSGDGPDDYEMVEPGEHDFSALSEGAPETDLPLVEWTERLGSADGRIFVLAAPEPGSDADLRAVTFPTPGESEADEAEAAVRVAHTMPDTESVDVIAVPAGESLDSGADETVLVEELAPDTVGDGVVLEEADYDVYVFPAGADRSSDQEAVLTFDQVALSAISTIHLRGTLDPDDAYPNYPLLKMPTAAKPNQRPESPPTTCVESQQRPFGHCQQLCSGGADDYGTGVCDGDAMGCRPVLNESGQSWEHRCGPVGDGEVGETCNPLADAGECAEGNYCLEYGNTREGYESGDERGLCHSLCGVDGDGASALACADGEACKPLSYLGDFEVGECGVPCEPNDEYTDPGACPDGLKSCKPISSLQHDSSGQGDTPPVVRREQAFCSTSGDVEPGEACRARNCETTAECMFPRSRKEQLLQSLLSPYVGGSGQRPSCELRCDPFDGDDSASSCGDDETCLFNYPWNAEVGHCATIESRKEPGETCDNPGLACGEDSICAPQGEETLCMRFCDYEGPDVEGELQQSTCPSGYTCHPFVRDVGVCQR